MPHAVSPPESPSTPTPVPLRVEGEEILFPSLPYDIQERAHEAIQDADLQQFVNHATLAKDRGRRRVCVEDFGEAGYERIRALAGDIKQHTLDHLDHYLERFIDRAEQAGTRVHFARDGDEANGIALAIARQQEAKTCVKSKSMVTEETHLLPELERAGVETLETDLGEFILQLDQDAPSHLVTPMIHKDRKAVARAFQRELGVDYTEDAERLTKIARQHLREKYRRADLGITGANFLVAGTGTVVVCTNEGNARFCTTAPKTHIAFVGIEKLVPTHEHLTVLLKLLARSSTAQPLTVYTHLMTGPRREHEHDGPDEQHVILIDNGRTGILADEEYRSTLRCIRCGACLNACPVYRKIGGHAYGGVYSGPIGALLTPLFKGLSNYKDLPHASSLCGACFEACPVKINIPDMLIRMRRDEVDERIPSAGERLAHRTFGRSLRTRLSYRITGLMQKWSLRAAADREGYVHRVPGPAGGWTDHRDLPAPAAHNFRHWWKQHRASEH